MVRSDAQYREAPARRAPAGRRRARTRPGCQMSVVRQERRPETWCAPASAPTFPSDIRARVHQRRASAPEQKARSHHSHVQFVLFCSWRSVATGRLRYRSSRHISAFKRASAGKMRGSAGVSRRSPQLPSKERVTARQGDRTAPIDQGLFRCLGLLNYRKEIRAVNSTREVPTPIRCASALIDDGRHARRGRLSCLGRHR